MSNTLNQSRSIEMDALQSLLTQTQQLKFGTSIHKPILNDTTNTRYNNNTNKQSHLNDILLPQQKNIFQMPSVSSYDQLSILSPQQSTLSLTTVLHSNTHGQVKLYDPSVHTHKTKYYIRRNNGSMHNRINSTTLLLNAYNGRFNDTADINSTLYRPANSSNNTTHSRTFSAIGAQILNDDNNDNHHNNTNQRQLINSESTHLITDSDIKPIYMYLISTDCQLFSSTDTDIQATAHDMTILLSYNNNDVQQTIQCLRQLNSDGYAFTSFTELLDTVIHIRQCEYTSSISTAAQSVTQYNTLSKQPSKVMSGEHSLAGNVSLSGHIQRSDYNVAVQHGRTKSIKNTSNNANRSRTVPNRPSIDSALRGSVLEFLCSSHSRLLTSSHNITVSDHDINQLCYSGSSLTLFVLHQLNKQSYTFDTFSKLIQAVKHMYSQTLQTRQIMKSKLCNSNKPSVLCHSSSPYICSTADCDELYMCTYNGTPDILQCMNKLEALNIKLDSHNFVQNLIDSIKSVQTVYDSKHHAPPLLRKSSTFSTIIVNNNTTITSDRPSSDTINEDEEEQGVKNELNSVTTDEQIDIVPAYQPSVYSMSDEITHIVEFVSSAQCILFHHYNPLSNVDTHIITHTVQHMNNNTNTVGLTLPYIRYMNYIGLVQYDTLHELCGAVIQLHNKQYNKYTQQLNNYTQSLQFKSTAHDGNTMAQLYSVSTLHTIQQCMNIMQQYKHIESMAQLLYYCTNEYYYTCYQRSSDLYQIRQYLLQSSVYQKESTTNQSLIQLYHTCGNHLQWTIYYLSLHEPIYTNKALIDNARSVVLNQPRRATRTSITQPIITHPVINLTSEIKSVFSDSCDIAQSFYTYLKSAVCYLLSEYYPLSRSDCTQLLQQLSTKYNVNELHILLTVWTMNIAYINHTTKYHTDRAHDTLQSLQQSLDNTLQQQSHVVVTPLLTQCNTPQQLQQYVCDNNTNIILVRSAQPHGTLIVDQLCCSINPADIALYLQYLELNNIRCHSTQQLIDQCTHIYTYTTLKHRDIRELVKYYIIHSHLLPSRLAASLSNVQLQTVLSTCKSNINQLFIWLQSIQYTHITVQSDQIHSDELYAFNTVNDMIDGLYSHIQLYTQQQHHVLHYIKQHHLLASHPNEHSLTIHHIQQLYHVANTDLYTDTYINQLTDHTYNTVHNLGHTLQHQHQQHVQQVIYHIQTHCTDLIKPHWSGQDPVDYNQYMYLNVTNTNQITEYCHIADSMCRLQQQYNTLHDTLFQLHCYYNTVQQHKSLLLSYLQSDQCTLLMHKSDATLESVQHIYTHTTQWVNVWNTVQQLQSTELDIDELIQHINEHQLPPMHDTVEQVVELTSDQRLVTHIQQLCPPFADQLNDDTQLDRLCRLIYCESDNTVQMSILYELLQPCQQQFITIDELHQYILQQYIVRHCKTQSYALLQSHLTNEQCHHMIRSLYNSIAQDHVVLIHLALYTHITSDTFTVKLLNDEFVFVSMIHKDLDKTTTLHQLYTLLVDTLCIQKHYLLPDNVQCQWLYCDAILAGCHSISHAIKTLTALIQQHQSYDSVYSMLYAVHRTSHTYSTTEHILVSGLKQICTETFYASQIDNLCDKYSLTRVYNYILQLQCTNRIYDKFEQFAQTIKQIHRYESIHIEQQLAQWQNTSVAYTVNDVQHIYNNTPLTLYMDHALELLAQQIGKCHTLTGLIDNVQQHVIQYVNTLTHTTLIDDIIQHINDALVVVVPAVEPVVPVHGSEPELVVPPPMLRIETYVLNTQLPPSPKQLSEQTLEQSRRQLLAYMCSAQCHLFNTTLQITGSQLNELLSCIDMPCNDNNQSAVVQCIHAMKYLDAQNHKFDSIESLVAELCNVQLDNISIESTTPHQQLIDYIQSDQCQLLSYVASTTGLSLSTSDLDALNTAACNNTTQCILYMKQLDSQQKQFGSIDALIYAVRKLYVIEQFQPFIQYIQSSTLLNDQTIKLSQLIDLIDITRTGVMLLDVCKILQSQQPVYNTVDELIVAVEQYMIEYDKQKTAPDNTTQLVNDIDNGAPAEFVSKYSDADKQRVIDYLCGDDCTLFSDHDSSFELNASDLESMIDGAGGLHECLTLLKQLSAQNVKLDHILALVPLCVSKNTPAATQ